MALALAPDTEERLRAVAAGRGLAPEEALNALLDPVLAEEEAEMEATRAGLRASIGDIAAGRSLSLEELHGRTDQGMRRKAGKVTVELKEHEAYLHHDEQDLEQDLQTLARLRSAGQRSLSQTPARSTTCA